MHSYLTVLLRVLKRERLYAAINIVGLSIGIACCLILGLYLHSELTYDRHNVHHANIYRVVNEFTTSGTAQKFAITSPELAPMLMADNPQIKAFVRFQINTDDGGLAIHHDNDTHYWERSYVVDDNVFDVFTHKVLFGDRQTALKDRGSIAVSETFAIQYFGNANPVGEIVTTDAGSRHKIALVYADQPANSHLKYDVLFPRSAFINESASPTERRQSLWGISCYTYLLMTPDFDPSSWARINDEFFRIYMTDMAKALNQSWHSWLQPLAATHLQSEVGFDEPNGNPIYLYGCAAVALFILAVACINYMNLSTARATLRARAVGVRKILGASRLSLGLQFLGEALAFAMIALIVSLLIIEVVLRFTPINALMGNQVAVDFSSQPMLLAAMLGVGLLVGLLSGLYPAVYLSSWAPLSALAGKHPNGKGNATLREGLVLLQLTISAAVIACTLLMAMQMHYISNKSLGFQKENRLVITLRGAATIDKLPTIRAELSKNAHILGVTQAMSVTGQNESVNTGKIEDNNGALNSELVTNMPISDNFVQVMGLEIAQGRDFSTRLLTDVGSTWLVNEAMVRKMGWTNPIGKEIVLGNLSGRVVGVARDFNFKSLHSPIEPLAMYLLVNDFANLPEMAKAYQKRLMIVSISSEDVGETLEYIEHLMRQMDSKHPFEYTFLDDTLDNLYESEQRLMKLIGILAATCIFIASLGLFGLASFTTEQRTREIGIRKVLGASTWQIIGLLSRRIMLLVAIAAVLSSVIAYFAIDEWLSTFAYRAGINPLIFVASAAVAAAVAFTTVALQSFKTARADPVRALRSQ
jgi:putative ABC transport system permease protein